MFSDTVIGATLSACATIAVGLLAVATKRKRPPVPMFANTGYEALIARMQILLDNHESEMQAIRAERDKEHELRLRCERAIQRFENECMMCPGRSLKP